MKKRINNSKRWQCVFERDEVADYVMKTGKVAY